MSKIPRNSSLYTPINQLDSNLQRSLQKYRRSTSKFQEQMNSIYEQAFQTRGLSRENRTSIMNRHTFERYKDNSRENEKDVICYHGQTYVKESKANRIDVQRTNRQRDLLSKHIYDTKQGKGRIIRPNILERKNLVKRKKKLLEDQIQVLEEDKELKRHQHFNINSRTQKERQPTPINSILQDLQRVKAEFDEIKWHQQPNRTARAQEKSQPTSFNKIRHYIPDEQDEIDDILINQQCNSYSKIQEGRQPTSWEKMKQIYLGSESIKGKKINQLSNRKIKSQDQERLTQTEKLNQKIHYLQEELYEIRRNEQSNRKARAQNLIERTHQNCSIEDINYKLSAIKNELERHVIQRSYLQSKEHSEARPNKNNDDLLRMLTIQAQSLEQNLKICKSSERKQRQYNRR